MSALHVVLYFFFFSLSVAPLSNMSSAHEAVKGNSAVTVMLAFEASKRKWTDENTRLSQFLQDKGIVVKSCRILRLVGQIHCVLHDHANVL